MRSVTKIFRGQLAGSQEHRSRGHGVSLVRSQSAAR